MNRRRLDEILRDHPSLADEVDRLAKVVIPKAGPLQMYEEVPLIPRDDSEGVSPKATRPRKNKGRPRPAQEP